LFLVAPRFYDVTKKQKRQKQIQYPIVKEQGWVRNGPAFLMHISTANEQSSMVPLPEH